MSTEYRPPDNIRHNERRIMRAMTKSQLARKAGVSMRTLRRWLADPYIQTQLAPLQLKKQQVKLPPRAVQIISEHYAIEID
jgi:phage terminase small subunit